MKVIKKKQLNDSYAPVISTNCKEITYMINSYNESINSMKQFIANKIKTMSKKDFKKAFYEKLSIDELTEEQIKNIAAYLKWDSDGIMLNTQPSYQRELVWTLDEKQKYVLFRLLGGEDVLIFNMSDEIGSPMEVVDGQQRLNAILEFYNGTLPVIYNNQELFYKDIQDPHITVHYKRLNFNNRKDLINYYIDMNTLGKNHTKVDIDIAITELLQEEK